MVKPFNAIKRKLSAEERAVVDAKKVELREEMALYDLRRARELSQERMAELMKITQPSVSKIEKQADMYVSTLRSYVEALGGHLVILAEMPDGTVPIQGFGQIHGAVVERGRRGRGRKGRR
jgi:DNA-binding XRE family transcriptional regulator